MLIHIALLTQRSSLLLQCLHSFAINLNAAGVGLWKRVVLEDPAHVMKQSIYAEEYIGRQMFILPPQKRIGIDIALVSRLPEPIISQLLIVVHALAHEMHLAQHVLGVLVSVAEVRPESQ